MEIGYDVNGKYLYFGNDGTNIGVINILESNGNVGIGKPDPTAKLEVYSTNSDAIMGKTTKAGKSGVYGEATLSSSSGVAGKNTNDGNGVSGYGQNGGIGVYGQGEGEYSYGVRGKSFGSSGTGVHGECNQPYGWGVWGKSTASSGYAGYFSGDVNVEGTLYGGGLLSMVDHPLDPENKYLRHSCVESTDMMNIYNGNVTLDNNGKSIVELPEWFEALNKDFRYQLTCIGGFSQVFIEKEISDNSFVIAGGKPGLKVSWQVTGIRKDAYANAHRIPVEENKKPEERGKYLHPKEFGFPETMGIDYERMKRVEEINKIEKENNDSN